MTSTTFYSRPAGIPDIRAVIGILAVGAYVAGLMWTMEHKTYDVWGAFISVPLLVLASWPMLAAAIRKEDDPWFSRLIIWAFALKLAGGIVRYVVAFAAYNGSIDARDYASHGERIATLWWHGQFSFDTGGKKLVGTGFLRLVTGAVYTVTGPSIISGFIVFAWLGFWGIYLSYRAFRIALPEGDHRLYARLIFFLPSLLFWPSAIGKEAWMMLCIGIIAYGTARLYTAKRGGFLLLALGLTGACMVRPHVAVLVTTAIVAGYALRSGRTRSPLAPVAKVVGLTVLCLASVILLNRANSFFGVSERDAGSTTSTVQAATAHRTSEGGSAFAAKPVSSPADMPKAFVTVVIRPFPWEAHNAQAFLTSLEGLLIAFMLARSWPRLRKLPRVVRRRPYAAFCLTYSLLFIYAFSAFGNFGLLARERVQMLPFVLALAALPKPDETLKNPVVANRHLDKEFA